MLNNVTVQGRLCADPELRQTQSGTSVVRFRIGCSRNYKNPNGEYDSDFISVTAWKGTADLIAKHFHKGDMLIVEGSIRSGSYDDKDGKKVYTTEIEAHSVYFCGSKPKANDSGYYPDEPPAPPMNTKTGGSAAFDTAGTDDDYPF
ncbi:MAG: single-stranded DNA-binding protein [Oscillospiraceae bacterium]|nr:single-stranded DNA-binding protein [Oscillospiraceae bacterium]